MNSVLSGDSFFRGIQHFMTSTLDERWDLKRAAEVIGTAEKTINSNVQLLTCSKF